MKQIFPTPNFHSFLKGVDSRVGLANTVQVERPAELRIFEGLAPQKLRDLAAQYNLNVVRRLAGTQIEFTRLAKI